MNDLCLLRMEFSGDRSAIVTYLSGNMRVNAQLTFIFKWLTVGNRL